MRGRRSGQRQPGCPTLTDPQLDRKKQVPHHDRATAAQIQLVGAIARSFDLRFDDVVLLISLLFERFLGRIIRAGKKWKLSPNNALHDPFCFALCEVTGDLRIVSNCSGKHRSHGYSPIDEECNRSTYVACGSRAHSFGRRCLKPDADIIEVAIGNDPG